MHAHFKNLKVVSSFKVNASEFVQSTTLQLLAELDDWTAELDKSIEIDVFYIDFQNAYDNVTHRKLQNFIARYGIRG